MKKFDLFIGFFGNSATVYNKAVAEHGDYKKVAHIAKCGKITWYVKPETVPADALLKIEHHADAMHRDWLKWLNSMPELTQYEKLLDRAPIDDLLHVTKSDAGLAEKIEYLKNACYEKSLFLERT